MIGATQRDHDYRADDRDRLWGAWPRPCGEVRIPMTDKQTIHPPKCRRGGVPPCPICPVRGECDWAEKVLNEDKQVSVTASRVNPANSCAGFQGRVEP